MLSWEFFESTEVEADSGDPLPEKCKSFLRVHYGGGAGGGVVGGVKSWVKGVASSIINK